VALFVRVNNGEEILTVDTDDLFQVLHGATAAADLHTIEFGGFARCGRDDIGKAEERRRACCQRGTFDK
jgi:hypothetical protein